MRRLIRIVGWLALTLVVLIIVTLVGFRGVAALRETLSPEEAAPAGALFATVDGLKMHYQVWGPRMGRRCFCSTARLPGPRHTAISPRHWENRAFA
jgi:NADH:ubiquinone oxidoreductase subunit H